MDDSMKIWTEKYRPSKFGEVYGQKDIVKKVKALVENGNMPHLLFSGSAGIGKCLTSETPILSGSGDYITIKEAYDKKIKSVLSLDKDGKIKEFPISYFYKNYSKKIYVTKTCFGTKIRTTPEHPFLVLEDGRPKWVEARNLKAGFFAASPEKLEKTVYPHKIKIPKDFFINKKHCQYRLKKRHSCMVEIPELNDKFYYWLGLVFGDGHVRNSSIRFYNNNKTLRNKFKQLSYEVFGKDIEIVEIGETNKTSYMEIRKGTTIVKLLEEHLGYQISCKKSHIIKVPKELYTSKEDCSVSFIKGLYETDGSFYPSFIEMASMSKDLISGLRYLLLSLGISSRIKEKRLLLSGKLMLKRFKEKIRPLIKIPEIAKNGTENVDVMTINKKDLSKLMNNFGITHKELGNGFFHILDRGRGSRKKVKELYSRLLDLSKERIKGGLNSIGVLNKIKENHLNYKEIVSHLKDKNIRKNVGFVRYDRLKEYSCGKREPNIKNYLMLIKKLQELRVYSGMEYNRVLEVLSMRNCITKTILKFNISYNEISKIVNMASASINYVLNNDGLSLKGMMSITTIYHGIKTVLEKRIFNEECISIMDYLDFLSGAEIIWDRIQDSYAEETGSEVYDINVAEVHNFIGGNSPLILHNTTLALVIAKEMFGENWKGNFLETNASDERGIDVIRNKVKDFARTKSVSTDYPKIIYLDECDSLTKEAQQALRRTMETYAGSARFILSCNFSSKLIDPIQSRCAVFRFKPLDKEELISVIDNIAEKEGLKISNDAKNALFDVCEGDVRRVINTLQSCASLSNTIEPNVIYEVSNFARPKEIDVAIKMALARDFEKARNKMLDIMLTNGLSGLDIIKQIQSEVVRLDVEGKTKLEMVKLCGEAEFRLVEGSDEFIQLEALLASFGLLQ